MHDVPLLRHAQRLPRPPRRLAEPADIEAASACDQAKAQVLSAETDEAFSLAERRMRLLCSE